MKSIGQDGSGWPKNFFPRDLTKNSVVGYPYPEKLVSMPFFLMGALFVYLCIHFAIEWYLTLPGVLAFLFLTCSITKQVIIRSEEKKIQILTRLFLRWSLRVENLQVSDFKAIIYTIHNPAEDWPQKRVGLLQQNKRKFWLRAFNCDDATSGTSRGAESFAWRLSCDTDLPIEDKPVKLIF